MKKLYFLGPKGTYSEIAANKINEILKFDEMIPISTIAKIVDLVNNDSRSFGILPIENSIEGIVRPTVDALLFNNVQINAQLEIDVRHCLFSNGNKNQIKHIISHPQALAQCQRYILNNFDENVDLIESSSTAAAIKLLEEKDETYAAIASLDAGKKYKIIDKNINDIEDNKTRFVLISKDSIELAPKTRTSIVFNTINKSGALLDVLEIFKKYNINLIYLESRPSKKVFGEMKSDAH